MNFAFLPFLLSTIILSSSEESPMNKTPLHEQIESYAWKNRIIVLYTPEANDKEFLTQKKILAEHKKGTQERDLVVIECVGDDLNSEDKGYLARHFDHDLAKFGVWLIGKDGGTKLSKNKSVATEKFFGLIDSMPMRRAEMKRDRQ